MQAGLKCYAYTPYSTKIWQGNFDIFDGFQLDSKNLLCQKFKALYNINFTGACFDESQWSSIKIFSIKHLKFQIDKITWYLELSFSHIFVSKSTMAAKWQTTGILLLIN